MIEHDKLLRMIRNRDLNGAREILDRAFWRGDETRPTWEHLRESLIQHHQHMIKLMVIWGATPSKDEWKDFQKKYDTKPSTSHSAFASYSKMLRRAGFDFKNIPDAPTNSTHRMLPLEPQYIPEEWKHVLSNFKRVGGKNACIAGGALRDIFNQKSVNDVDIFLLTQKSKARNKRIIQKAFKRAKIDYTITKEPVMRGSFIRDAQVKQDLPVKTQLKLRTQSWEVTAGNYHTKYNIVFLDQKIKITPWGPYKEINKKKGLETTVLNFFDYNLCKIAFNGENVLFRDAFIKDSTNQIISWDSRNATTKKHLTKMMKKYPNFNVADDLMTFYKTKQTTRKTKKSTHSIHRVYRGY